MTNKVNYLTKNALIKAMEKGHNSVNVKRLLAVLSFMFIAVLTFAQGNYQDVVYLKNGSIIRGIIIEQVPDKSIKIETVDNNVFVYQMNEIEKLTKEPYMDKRNNSSTKTIKQNDDSFKPGYKGIVEAGYQVAAGANDDDRLRLDIINGYQFNPYLSAGLGVGVRNYFNVSATFIPVFADVRGSFMPGKISPYISLGIGYSISTKSTYKGGFLLHPTAGVSFKLSDKLALNAGVGYELQRVGSSGYSGTVTDGAISFNIGISF